MIRVFVLVLALVALLFLWAGGLDCAFALLGFAFFLTLAWEAGGGDRPVRLPPEVLDPAVRAKVGEVIRPDKQGDEGIEAWEGVQRSG
jgi:hypothetical protein